MLLWAPGYHFSQVETHFGKKFFCASYHFLIISQSTQKSPVNAINLWVVQQCVNLKDLMCPSLCRHKCCAGDFAADCHVHIIDFSKHRHWRWTVTYCYWLAINIQQSWQCVNCGFDKSRWFLNLTLWRQHGDTLVTKCKGFRSDLKTMTWSNLSTCECDFSHNKIPHQALIHSISHLHQGWANNEQARYNWRTAVYHPRVFPR